MTTFKKCSKERYWEMLEVLPPLGMSSRGFLVGEAWSHRDCTVTGKFLPTFRAMVEMSGPDGKYYLESTSGLTSPEWRALKLDSLTIEESK